MTVRETGPACGRAGSCFFLPLFTEFIVFFLDGRCNARHCLDHQGIEKAGWFINANRPALLIHWDSVLINRQNSCYPDLWNVRQPSASSHEHSGAPSSGTLINQAWTTGRASSGTLINQAWTTGRAEFGQLTRSEMRHWKRSVTAGHHYQERKKGCTDHSGGYGGFLPD